ncbi:hypothetical protein JCM19039_1704 [Geomicrobium sp. JCM 19039]|nr:hypothetical protein JCM19039_1704 [Geomicrobium sp. JCM 19039]
MIGVLTLEPLDTLQAFTTTDHLQPALQSHYERIGFSDPLPKKYAYANTLPFLHRYLQARRLLASTGQNDVHIQPLLLYYSFTEFMKAIVLFHDPEYPSTTSVLQHGVSTRKRKKKDYRFIDDEVKIQQNGLLPLLNRKMFHVKMNDGERFTMGKLFGELDDLRAILQHDRRLSNQHKDARNLPALFVHYLILYNLSMICRYETEWWGELISSRSSIDLPLIEHYLRIAPLHICEEIAIEMRTHLISD